jgi:dihydrofolate synthase/folylpolyglutamate synthase
LSYFEISAAMAFAFFADEAADAAVVEVGLGGRLDATNVCAGAVSVITEIGLDHQEYLGDTIEEITAEKLGIVEPGSILVTGPLVDEAWPVVEAMCRERDVTELRYGRDFHLEDVTQALDGWRLSVAGVHETYPDIHLPIHGRHQTINFAVAVAAVEAMTERALDPEAVIDAAAVMSSPGRMEPVAVDPFVLLDGAHNPDGFKALGHALREEFPTTTWILVTGAMDDKDIESMYPELAGLIEHVVVTSVDSPRAIDPDDLAHRMRPLIGADTEVVPTPTRAIERAREEAGPEGNVLVAGSLYLVGAVRSAIKGESAVQPNEH